MQTRYECLYFFMFNLANSLGVSSHHGSFDEQPVAERFMRILKEQCLYLHRFTSLAEARTIIGEFIKRYNTQWLTERLGHQTPAPPQPLRRRPDDGSARIAIAQRPQDRRLLAEPCCDNPDEGRGNRVRYRRLHPGPWCARARAKPGGEGLRRVR